MMSLPSIQETVVFTNANFSSYDNSLTKELFEIFLVLRNFLAMKMKSRKTRRDDCFLESSQIMILHL